MNTSVIVLEDYSTITFNHEKLVPDESNDDLLVCHNC
jgi:hypothetical protein